MKLLQFLIVFCYCTWCFTVAKEEETAPHQDPEQGFTGTTHETKNQDGSTLTVTHFKGSFPGSHSHPAFPGWAIPGSPFFNAWGSPVTPVGASPEIPDKKLSKRDSKSNNEKGQHQQQKDSPASTVQSINSSSIPFSKRFPAPPRYSTKFHYPELPQVYWQHHKRPFVPLLDPELYGFNDVEGDIKQDL